MILYKRVLTVLGDHRTLRRCLYLKVQENPVSGLLQYSYCPAYNLHYIITLARLTLSSRNSAFSKSASPSPTSSSPDDDSSPEPLDLRHEFEKFVAELDAKDPFVIRLFDVLVMVGCIICTKPPKALLCYRLVVDPWFPSCFSYPRK